MKKVAALPMILSSRFPGVNHGQFDCDCACDLELPARPDLPLVLGLPPAPGSFDCDCACALELTSEQAAQPEAIPWIRASETVPIPLNEGWQAHYNPSGPIGVAVLNDEAQRVLAVFNRPILPVEAAKRVPELPVAVVWDAFQHLAEVGLVRPAIAASLHAVRPTTLSAWLHITEVCNLSCPYCYVHKRPGTMSAEVGRLAVNRLMQMATCHGYRALKLKYAGGEPTLRFPLIQTIHDHAARQAASAGLDLEEVILSNGADVTDGMLDSIVEAGMALMISLDGDAATHDRVRFSRDGRSTYASVTCTVDRALARGLQPSVSITLTALNLEGVSSAVAFALERDLPFNLNFYRECIGADSAGPSLLMPNAARLVETMEGIFDLIRAHPTYTRPVTGILDRTRVDLPHQAACSAGRDYLVIDTEGRVAACQMLLDEPWTDLTDKDALETVRRNWETVFGPTDEAAGCRTCTWRTACAGGCPLMRRTTLHDHYCQVYRSLFPALIRLEARRLLAAHTALSALR